jgi:hypothetical protein
MAQPLSVVHLLIAGEAFKRDCRNNPVKAPAISAGASLDENLARHVRQPEGHRSAKLQTQATIKIKPQGAVFGHPRGSSSPPRSNKHRL